MDLKQKKQFYSLLNALREEVISDEQLGALEHLISSDTEAAREYVLFVKLWTDFQFFGAANAKFSETSADLGRYADFWEAMANYEKQAPELELPKEKPQRELIQKVVYPVPEKRKISRFGIVTLLNAAAVLLFFLVLRVVPPSGGLEAAVLSDSLNAQWANRKGVFQKGDRLRTGNKMVLDRGLVEIEFDGGARAVLEAPAEFKILAEDRLGLTYGKVYATVPEKAIGFSVYTPIAKIIDLGTEFGVQQDMHGNTELHVVRGKTSLVSGVQGSRINVYVEAGTAKRLDTQTGQIKDIVCNETLFARHIDSDTQVIWRGQKTLDLADIVGGGNGLGSGAYSMSIDPTSGKPSGEQDGRRGATNDFRPVAFNPFIDGVFVPNGQSLQIVSSQGHLFRECPETTGLTCENIINVTTNLDFLATQTRYVSDASAHAILMHANMGITFDLQAMRGLLKGVDIQRFQSQFGIRRYAVRPDASNADFWVLVDGKLKFKKEHVKIGHLHFLDIELSEDDRFLTLVITEGDDAETRFLEGRVLTAIDSDWGMFMEPVLVLKYAD
jgi:hypothetical protein